MKTKIITSFIIIFTIGLFSSCVKDDTYGQNSDTGIVLTELVANKTIQDIVTFVGTSSLVAYTSDDIIEAYVTSTDETGTFYNTLCFQDIPTNATQPIGFSVTANFSSYVKGFTPGRKAYIKLKGLYIGKVDGSLKIGTLYNGEIGRISENAWQEHLFVSGTKVSEDNMVRTVSLTTASTDTNLNTLVEIDNVQFADGSLNRTFFDIDSGGSATNHNIVSTTAGRTQYLRVSQYATFARQNVPSGRGKIRGIMTKYGTDFQFIIRHTNDLKLTNPRTYNFPNTVSENFQSFPLFSTTTNPIATFPNYLNFEGLGTKRWSVRSVNSSQCLQMSSFGGALENSKGYFVVPVNMTAASTFTFQVDADFYTGGLGLKVYRSSDYSPIKKVSEATLYDITSSFTFPTAQTTTFVSAGTYNIPVSVTGNGYFIFEYSGSNIPGPSLLTTNCNIDNIVIN